MNCWPAYLANSLDLKASRDPKLAPECEEA